MTSPQRLREKIKDSESTPMPADIIQKLEEENKQLREKIKKLTALLPKGVELSDDDESETSKKKKPEPPAKALVGEKKKKDEDTKKPETLPPLKKQEDKKDRRILLESQSEFDKLNRSDAPPLVVWYGRETCGRCVMFRPAWEKLQQQQPRAEFAEMDCGKRTFYIDLGVSGSIGLPTLIFFRGGERFKTIQPGPGWSPDSYARQAGTIVQEMLNHEADKDEFDADSGGGMNLRTSSTMGGASAKSPFFTLPARSGQTNALIKEALETHNKYRADHGVPMLEWDEHCFTTAKAWAETMAKEKKMYHGGHKGMGQNLAMSTGKLSIAHSVKMWYDEIEYYDYAKPKFDAQTGHFTQVVWKGTTKVGMAVKTAKNGATYICANYASPGNFMGRFAENVFPKGGVPPSGQMPKKPERDFGREMSLSREDSSLDENALASKLQSIHRGRMERQRTEDMLHDWGAPDDDDEPPAEIPLSARAARKEPRNKETVLKGTCVGGTTKFSEEMEKALTACPMRKAFEKKISSQPKSAKFTLEIDTKSCSGKLTWQDGCSSGTMTGRWG